jgi:hypothetical protein
MMLTDQRKSHGGATVICLQSLLPPNDSTTPSRGVSENTGERQQKEKRVSACAVVALEPSCGRRSVAWPLERESLSWLPQENQLPCPGRERLLRGRSGRENIARGAPLSRRGQMKSTTLCSGGMVAPSLAFAVAAYPEEGSGRRSGPVQERTVSGLCCDGNRTTAPRWVERAHGEHLFSKCNRARARRVSKSADRAGGLWCEELGESTCLV